MKLHQLLSLGILSLSAVQVMGANETSLMLGHKLVCTATIKMKDGSSVQPGKQERSGKSIREQATLPTDANSFGTSNLVRRSICSDSNDANSCYRYLFATIPGALQLTTSTTKDFDLRGIAFRDGVLETEGYRKFKFSGIETSDGTGTVIDIRNTPERTDQTIGVLREPIIIRRLAKGFDLEQSYPNALEVENRCTFDRKYHGIPKGRFESASFDETQFGDYSTVFHYGYGVTSEESEKEALRKCQASGGKNCQVGNTDQNDFKSPEDQ